MTRSASITGVSALFFAGFFALIGSQAVAADVTIGDKPTFKSADNFDYQLSDDKKAFTLAFTGFEVTVDSAKLPAPVAARVRSEKTDAPIGTRVFSIVIPLTGSKSVRNAFFVSGFVLTGEGTSGTLVFSINGQNTVTKFAAGMNKDFVQRLNFRTKYASEVRITVFLLAERDSAGQGAAFLGVNAIDTDTGLAKKPKPAGKR